MSIAKLCGDSLPFARSPLVMPTILQDLIGHMRWADEIVAVALSSTARQPDRTRVADPVSVFAHIAGTEHLWYCRIRGTPTELAVWPDTTVAESRAIANRHADLFEELVAGGGDELDEIVSYRNSAGRDFRNSVRDIVIHVTMHGSYHRGQIARLVRASGGEPPYTDYIQYRRLDQLS
jgi:uncharacterized damage-inducible protein DinB